MKALSYSGDGTDPGLVGDLLVELAKPPFSFRVSTVQAGDLHQLDHLDKGVLVVPGGRDLPYLRDLSSANIASKANFVRRGGRYVGLCAGAFFAAAEILFDAGLPSEICGPRPLKFFAFSQIKSVLWGL